MLGIKWSDTNREINKKKTKQKQNNDCHCPGNSNDWANALGRRKSSQTPPCTAKAEVYSANNRHLRSGPYPSHDCGTRSLPLRSKPTSQTSL